jgi:hypothetical protein
MPALPFGRPVASFVLDALGGGSFTETGFGGRGLADSRSPAGAGTIGWCLVLPSSLGQSVQKLLANLGCQGSHVLMNLRVLIG